MQKPYFSLIVPVYNRPGEVEELLQSISVQTVKNFEVILVEDGSTERSESVAAAYGEQLDLAYYFIPNGGPGPARNYGAGRALGEYLVILDSDCILPSGYIAALCAELEATGADAFGGPDRASEHFTDIQKAINYAMTSFFTTGGIRGGGKELDRFYPRSFNMGVRRSVFEALGGFAPMRFGEDIDFSLRIYEAGYRVALFSSAWVYHKRRTDWRKFYRQVYNSGIARIHLYRKHPASLKPVHCLPAAFTVGEVFLLMGGVFCVWCLAPLLLYAVLVWADAGIRNRSFRIGGLSVAAACIQLTGYGAGFLAGVWRRLLRKEGEFSAFEKTFYK
ncbi:MAG: glycosyltransferase [Tannerellaceae bacterium]|nr:glycosyltransferase [Tannerellaceae bacterium]